MQRLSACGRTALVALALALIVGEGTVALGQAVRRGGMRRYQGATSEPTVSPYLNLIRPGADPGFNYFTLVQPQVQQQRGFQAQNQNIQSLGRQLQRDEIQGPFGSVVPIRATGGRAASYQNYSHYYPALGGTGGGGGGGRSYKVPTGGGGMGMGMGGMGMGGGF